MRLGLVSLGCDKNTVDSERMLAELVGHGAERVDVSEAEVILVNTCGFIDAAKEEIAGAEQVTCKMVEEDADLRLTSKELSSLV